MKDSYGFDPKNLKKLVQRSCMTNAQIEDEAGISKSVLSRYLNGYLEPDMRSAVKLAEFYRVTVDCIIGREELSDDDTRHDEMALGEKLALLGAVEAMKYRRDKVIIEFGKMMDRMNEITEKLSKN